MSSVFLSHSHGDKPFARKLAADLRRAGHSVWIDEAEIDIGDSLIEKIREGIDEVDFVAAILSNASINSSWVIKELDLASNREIEENKVVVLPLLLEKVSLPGFLKGKFYGDFSEDAEYEDTLELLLRKLGPVKIVENINTEEVAKLKAELAAALDVSAQHKAAASVYKKSNLRGKPKELIEAIQKANESHPLHEPVNISHAFKMGKINITLDYLLWCIAKAERRGGHPIEALLTIEDKWANVEAMLSAYGDLLDEYEG